MFKYCWSSRLRLFKQGRPMYRTTEF